MARRRAGERFVKDAPYDVRDKDAEIRAATSYVPRKSSRNGAVIFNIATFIATCAAVLGIAFAATGGAESRRSLPCCWRRCWCCRPRTSR